VRRRLDADVLESAQAPKLAHIATDGFGVYRIAHLCR